MLLAKRYCPRSLQTGVARCVAKVAAASVAGTGSGTGEVLAARRGLRWEARQGLHRTRPSLARRQQPSRMRLLLLLRRRSP